MTIINKYTGRDVSREFLGLMEGIITNEELFFQANFIYLMNKNEVNQILSHFNSQMTK